MWEPQQPVTGIALPFYLTLVRERINVFIQFLIDYTRFRYWVISFIPINRNTEFCDMSWLTIINVRIKLLVSRSVLR
jgi:hypothetical protein